jgi:hypothetical protein
MRCLFILLSIFLLYSPSLAAMKAPRGPCAISVAGGGAFTDGVVESFESSTYDTTTWTETDSGGVITSGDSTTYQCGSKSLKIISASTTSGQSTATLDFGNDNDLYFAVHFKVPSINAYSENYLIKFTDGTNIVAGVKILRNSGNPYMRLSSPLGDPSDPYTLTSSTNWYRLELHVVGAGGNTISRLYLWSGSAWDVVNTDGAAQEITLPSGNYTTRYLQFTDDSDNGSSTFYLDAAKLSLSGGSWLGTITCP